MHTKVAIGPFPTNLLGIDVLKGRQWYDTQGNSWSFGIPQIRKLSELSWTEVRSLQAAPALPRPKLLT